MPIPPRLPQLLGALALSSAAALVGVTATSAWAADDRADRGQHRAAQAQAAPARTDDADRRPDEADRGQDRATEAQAENDRRGAHRQGGDANPSAAETNPDGSKDPGGNNGTIKVDLLPFDDAGRHDTDTHSDDPRCLVEIEFFGFDADEVVTVAFRGQAPTDFGPLTGVQPATVTLDADGVTGTGDDTTEKLDGQQRYDLSAALQGKPESRNGYHIRVEVDAVDAPGGAKTKLFWLDCNPTLAAGATTTTGGTTTDTGGTTGAAVATGALVPGATAVAIGALVPGAATATGDSVSTVASVLALPAQASEVASAAVERGQAGAQAEQPRPERLEVKGVQFERGTPLARTGTSIALLALGGLTLTGAGTVLRRAGRRPEEADLEA